MFRYSFLLILIVSACATNIQVIKKNGVDFSQRQTWCWLKGCDLTFQGNEVYLNKKSLVAIANSIAVNMHNKGYEMGDNESDLVLNYYVIVDDASMEINRPQTELWDYQSLFNEYPKAINCLKGTLVIDVLDRENAELIWTSQLTKYTDYNTKLEKADIQELVAKAMKKLPNRQ